MVEDDEDEADDEDEGASVLKCPQEDGGLPLICYWFQAYHFVGESKANTTDIFAQNGAWMAEWGSRWEINDEIRTFGGVGFA